MSTVKLRYIGGLLHADVPILDREGEPLDEHGAGCLVRGEVFECDKKIAGRLPKLADDGTLEVGDDGQPVDPGEGLLAQVGNFEFADAAAAPAKPKLPRRRRAAKKTAAPAKPAAAVTERPTETPATGENAEA